MSSGPSFLSIYRDEGPACAVVDLRMPEVDGLELQRRLGEADVDLPIIFITSFGDVPSSVQAMKAGAIDFLEKPFDDEVMIETIRFALRVAEERRAQRGGGEMEARLGNLSPREMSVYKHLVGGLSNKLIARELGISPRTVEIHRGNLMRKVGARNMVELARVAFEHGIVPPES